MIKLSDLCIDSTAILRDALIKIDANAQGLLFVIKDEVLAGVLTDGDIRRAMLTGKTIKDSIDAIYNDKCKALHQNSSVEDIQKSLSSKIKIIPLLNDSGNVVDYASLSRLHKTPVLEPLLGGNELEYVTDCIKTNWISSQGKYVRQFELEVERYTGSKFALAVSNGTVAIHLALVSLGIGPGDEVIVPDITFGATLNAVVLAGARPVIIDVNKDTWNMSVDLLKESITSKTKAILPVHIYGLPCNMPAIMRIANENSLYVIEDCAEALGAAINEKHVGTFGDIGTFSFFGNKVITCGEGGALIFNDEEVFNKAKILRDHGMTPGKRYWHDVVGFNYRLTNIQAAVGCAQFEQLDSFREKRKKIFSWYEKYLLKSGYFDCQRKEEGYELSYWLYTVVLKDHSLIARDDLINKLIKVGIDTRPVFYPMSKMPPFLNYDKRLTGVSDCISDLGISLPTSVYLSESDIESISQEVIQSIEEYISLKRILDDA